MSIDTQIIQIEQEFVDCPLCKQNETRLHFRVDTKNLQLSRLWKDGVEYPVDKIETLVKCKHCGFVYVNPRIKEMQGIATYNLDQEINYFATTYAARRRAYEQLIRRIPKWLGYCPQNLLDVGCGDGLLVEVARDGGLQASGVEISPALVAKANERLGTNSVANIPLQDLPGNFYDVITLINVIEHLREPTQMLRDILDLLRPKGILLVHAPNFGGLPARIKGAHWYQIEPFSHFNYFTSATLTAMLKNSGYIPLRRFSLIIHNGWRGKLHQTLDTLGIYLDNGLGVIARKL